MLADVPLKRICSLKNTVIGSACLAVCAISQKGSTNARPIDNTEALHSNPVLRYCFTELRKYKSYSPENFTCALEMGDALVGRLQKLTTKTITPNVCDRPDCFLYYKKCTQALENMIRQCDRDLRSPQATMYIMSLYTKIHGQVGEIWFYILKKTRDIY